ncbi:MAG: hypothetical protein SVR08_15565 [Spirochaetota bacterium]|nr:hypothetical protein [Spirochaetota bacterium]
MINKDFEAVDMRLEQIERRLFQFMIWSFSFTTTSAGIIIAVQKLT